MPTRTLTALYDSKDAAERAKDQLKAAGVDQIDIHNQDAADTLTDTARTAGEKTRGFLDKIADFFGGHHEDAHAYVEGVRRGHYLLTAKVDDGSADAASSALSGSGAVDVDQAQAGWRAEGWAPGQRAYDQGASSVTASDIARDVAPATTSQATAAPPTAAQAATPQASRVAAATGAAAATAEDFGEPTGAGAQIAPELPALDTAASADGARDYVRAPAAASAATATATTGLAGDAALERVTDGGASPKPQARTVRREDDRSNAYVRSYVPDEAYADSYAAEGVTSGETVGEGLLTQDTTVRDTFQPKADAARDLDQGIPRSDISPRGSLNRPA